MNTFLLYLIIPLCFSFQTNEEIVPLEDSKFLSKAQEAKAYAKKNNMDTTLTILVDMSIHAGKYRMFVYDQNEKKVIRKGLCSHGSGSSDNGGKIQFSNVPGSFCTSLGKYKIGIRSYSNWGVNFHYKLHGLESTNDNAYKRIVVLHSYDFVEDYEVYPNEVIESLGCPMVSNEMMLFLDKQIKAAKQPVLLWIYI